MNQSNAYDTLIGEIVQLLIREKEKAFPAILAKIYDQAMVAEREVHLGASPYERAEGRDGCLGLTMFRAASCPRRRPNMI